MKNNNDLEFRIVYGIILCISRVQTRSVSAHNFNSEYPENILILFFLFLNPFFYIIYNMSAIQTLCIIYRYTWKYYVVVSF